MIKYIVQGGTKLSGSVTISGAKNAAVAILPATLLVSGPCRIENVPDISDVRLLLEILRDMGAEIRRYGRNTLEIDCTRARNATAPIELVRRIRASYYLIGAELGRFGHAHVAMPGGCNFGVRPIDQHIKGFEAMGAMVEQSGGYVCADAPKGGLRGGHVYLDIVSVGATMNILLAAVLCSGMTIIENCAKEPHIVDLANFLNSMGADIKGAGTDSIKIRGVKRLTGGSYGIIPDQIEAGTYMAAVAATGGQLLLNSREGQGTTATIALPMVRALGTLGENIEDYTGGFQRVLLELADALNEVLSKKWRDLRGIEIVSFGVSSVTADEDDEKMLKELQRNAAFMDTTRAAAHLVGSQGDAMKMAANNQGGAAMALMGMNMAGQAGGMNAGNLFAMGQQQAAQQAAAQPAPAAPAGWTCACGHAGNTGKFCAECGQPKPASDEWTCACGTVNKGKFCANCGTPRP